MPSQSPHRLRTALLVGGAIVVVVLLAVIAARRGREPGAGAGLLDAAVVVPSLTGTITAISGDTITFAVEQMLGVPVPERSPLRTRTVRIAPETAITGRSEKSDAAYEGELAKYFAERRAGKRPAAPESHRTQTLGLRDLAVGDTVRVSAGGADIKQLVTFTAASIEKL